MSWLARSIANSLNLNDESDSDSVHHQTAAGEPHSAESLPTESPPPSSESQPGRGVKEDLSDLTKTLTRQLWGVASFLAPDPISSESPPPDPSVSGESLADLDAGDAAGIAGIRSDFAEIGGRFRTGISKLSSNKAVSEITKIASNFLQFGSDLNDVGDVVGVTDEVLAFAKNIALHPETWMDFPLEDDEDADDFELSDAQQEHALAVEHLTPSLSALRIELCPGYMSEGCFWKIYFVLLHPRLNKPDAELLSTPQILEARSKLTIELQNRNKATPDQDLSGRGTSYSKETTNTPEEESHPSPPNNKIESIRLKTSVIEPAASTAAANPETEKHPVSTTEIQIIDKSVVEEGPSVQTKYQNSPSGSSSRVLVENDDDDADDWLKEESLEVGGGHSGITAIPIENDEDVSFSDLEDDDGEAPADYKKVPYNSNSSIKDLCTSSGESSKDIHAVNVERAASEKVITSCNPNTKESNESWLNFDDIEEV